MLRGARLATFPIHIFDLHTAYLAATNVLLPRDDTQKRPKKDLASACRAYGLEGWERIDKGSIAADIGNGLWQNYGSAAVFEYCEEDVRMSTALLRAQLLDIATCRPLTFPACCIGRTTAPRSVARIQATGMPIDMRLWNLVQENKAAVVRELLRRLRSELWL